MGQLNSFGAIGLALLYFLLTTVGYWGSVIQGIRSIANGRTGTIRSACVFELILCVPHLIRTCREDRADMLWRACGNNSSGLRNKKSWKHIRSSVKQKGVKGKTKYF
ncbi:MAG: hypothetical protein J6Z43_03570 [Clostridiales bacterium]|nr:hypothetical protein [Clostridiales bacterium]